MLAFGPSAHSARLSALSQQRSASIRDLDKHERFYPPVLPPLSIHPVEDSLRKDLVAVASSPIHGVARLVSFCGRELTIDISRIGAQLRYQDLPYGDIRAKECAIANSIISLALVVNDHHTRAQSCSRRNWSPDVGFISICQITSFDLPSVTGDVSSWVEDLNIVAYLRLQAPARCCARVFPILNTEDVSVKTFTPRGGTPHPLFWI